MARTPAGASGNAAPVTVRMEPALIERLDNYAASYTRGNRSSAVIELITRGLADLHIGIHEHTMRIPPLNEQMVLEGPLPDPEPRVATPIPAHLKARIDDAAERARLRKIETCPHSSARRSTVSNLMRCPDCGANQTMGGEWHGNG